MCVYFPFGKGTFFGLLTASVLFVYVFVCLFHLVVNYQSLLHTYSVTSTMRIAGDMGIVGNTRVPRGQRPVCKLLEQSVGPACELSDRFLCKHKAHLQSS